MLDNFSGKISWIHKREGHAGKAYWPGGQSGVTLDPGVDLGYIDRQLFLLMYGELMSQAQIADAVRVSGYHGEEAKHFLSTANNLKQFKISREEAEKIFPFVADKYWIDTLARWPKLSEAPSCVQTALLSLTYNRGPANRGLNILNDLISGANWKGLGTAISKMQQDHQLDGIRKRRRLEGALILNNYQKETKIVNRVVSGLKRMIPRGLIKL